MKKNIIAYLLAVMVVLCLAGIDAEAKKPEITRYDAQYLDKQISVNLQWQSSESVVLVRVAAGREVKEIKIDPYDNKKTRSGYTGEVNAILQTEIMEFQESIPYTIQVEDEDGQKSDLVTGKLAIPSRVHSREGDDQWGKQRPLSRSQSGPKDMIDQLRKVTSILAAPPVILDVTVNNSGLGTVTFKTKATHSVGMREINFRIFDAQGKQVDSQQISATGKLWEGTSKDFTLGPGNYSVIAQAIDASGSTSRESKATFTIAGTATSFQSTVTPPVTPPMTPPVTASQPPIITQPPVDQPPVDEPPVEPPSVEPSPPVTPPVMPSQPPTIAQPPIDQTPVMPPPVEPPPPVTPPIVQPPVDQPPVVPPPVEPPPPVTPPVAQPPIDQPPVVPPPVEPPPPVTPIKELLTGTDLKGLRGWTIQEWMQPSKRRGEVTGDQDGIRFRSTAGNTRMGIMQTLNADVSGAQKLILTVVVKAVEQRLDGTGWQGREAPVAIFVTYTDVNGQVRKGLGSMANPPESQANRMFWHGFYYLDPTGNSRNWNGTKVNRGSWYTYEFDLMSLNPKPKTIHAVGAEGSGWSVREGNIQSFSLKYYGNVAEK